jgi:hypothetical protein
MSEFRVGRYGDHNTLDEATNAAAMESLQGMGKSVLVYQAVKTVKVVLPKDSSIVQVTDYDLTTDESDDD